MKYFPSALVVITVFLVVTGCAGDPEPAPIPTPPPAVVPPTVVPPPPEEPPRPEPEIGHAPLVDTHWSLTTLYGDMRTLAPVSGPVWIEFAQDGTIFVQGPENTIEGGYQAKPDENSSRNDYNFEEGALTGETITRNRRAGSHSEFEDVLLENLQLLKGYYIRGETPQESTLTIWGGYLSEEVVLMELKALPEETYTE